MERKKYGFSAVVECATDRIHVLRLDVHETPFRSEAQGPTVTFGRRQVSLRCTSMKDRNGIDFGTIIKECMIE